MVADDILSRIEACIFPVTHNPNVPGLSVAVVRRGSVLMCRGYGYANVELDVLAQADTVYKVGSISKHFIATAILLLKNSGAVNLDDSVARFFGTIPNPFRKITLRHLLTHTAGLPRDPACFDPHAELPVRDYINYALRTPPLAEPGEIWTYSNLGYFFLAEVIERVTRIPFGVFLQRDLFDTADLTRTSVSRFSDIVFGRASSYLTSDGVLKNAGELQAIRPSGAVLSSVADLASWAITLTNGTIFKFPLLRELSAPTILSDGTTIPYGFGLYLGNVNANGFVRHGGGEWFFRAEMLIFPVQKSAIILMANAREVDLQSLAMAIATLVSLPQD